MKSTTVVECAYKHHTGKALLVVWEGQEFWLPLSQVEINEHLDDLEVGDEIEIELPDWLAEERSLG